MDDFYFLLKHFILIGEYCKGITFSKDDDWLIDGEKIAVKYISNLLSIAYLLEGTKPKIPDLKLNINFYDFFSVTAISRSALEGYLTFHYIFVDDKVSKEERKFRYDLWNLSNLINRQRYTNLTQKIVEVKNKEKEQINKLLEEIKKSPYFSKKSKSISEKSYKKIVKNDLRLIDWKPGGWIILAKNAEINENFFNDAYNYFSSILHNEEIVSIYLNNFYSISKEKASETSFQLIETCLSYLNPITASFIDDYSRVFERAKEYLSKKRELQERMKVLIYLKSNAYSSQLSH